MAVLLGGAAFVWSHWAAAEPQEPVAPDSVRFENYPDVPPFKVVPRKDDLLYYPCGQCHDTMEPNPEIRQLDDTHINQLNHGRGRIWCLSCHDTEKRNYLRTLLGERVDFDDAYLVCGGCHAGRQKDWLYGAHGKRIANWKGERTLLGCPACHDPHDPSIKPRAPKPAPPVRAGLERQPHVLLEHENVWDEEAPAHE
jgi:uncharacterized CHY-type Zn-finger protein